MYCSQCGKFIDYEATVCKECEAAKNQTNTNETNVPPFTSNADPYFNQDYYTPADPYFYSAEPEPQNRMFGFGKALASTIMGYVGFIFAYFAIIISMVEGAAGLVFTLFASGLSIPSLIFGISSIKCFIRRKATCAKNIPTLILGIVGITGAGLTLFFAFISLIFSLAFMSV